MPRQAFVDPVSESSDTPRHATFTAHSRSQEHNPSDLRRSNTLGNWISTKGSRQAVSPLDSSEASMTTTIPISPAITPSGSPGTHRSNKIADTVLVKRSTSSPVAVEREIIKEPEEFIAKHSFKATQPMQLSFSKGDVVVVTSKLKSGWWQGSLPNGDSGWLPGSYLKPADDFLKATAVLPSDQQQPQHRNKYSEPRARFGGPVLASSSMLSSSAKQSDNGVVPHMDNERSTEAQQISFDEKTSSNGDAEVIPKEEVEKAVYDATTEVHTSEHGKGYSMKRASEHEQTDDLQFKNSQTVETTDANQHQQSILAKDRTKVDLVNSTISTSHKKQGPCTPSSYVDPNELYVIKHAFKAQKEKQLTLPRRGFVHVKARKQSGWWLGDLLDNDGQTIVASGWFPAGYVMKPQDPTTRKVILYKKPGQRLGIGLTGGKVRIFLLRGKNVCQT